MSAMGLGLLFEEHRGEIVAAWKRAVERELGVKEPALGFAAAPMLRELSLCLSGGADAARRAPEAWKRCAILVRSTATGAQVARELKTLRRCAWDALRARGAPVGPGERRSVDEWLDDALAEALERLERVRQRMAAFADPRPAPVIVPPLAARPAAAPPRAAPSPRPAALAATVRPPPLPPRAARAVSRIDAPRARAAPGATPGAAGEEPILELDPIDERA